MSHHPPIGTRRRTSRPTWRIGYVASAPRRVRIPQIQATDAHDPAFALATALAAAVVSYCPTFERRALVATAQGCTLVNRAAYVADLKESGPHPIAAAIDALPRCGALAVVVHTPDAIRIAHFSQASRTLEGVSLFVVTGGPSCSGGGAS